MSILSLLRCRTVRCIGIGLVKAFLATAVSAADRVSPIDLDADNPDHVVAGRLIWRGGVAITGGDIHFGGLSALDVSDDGKHLVALSDRGRWVTASIDYHDGMLSDVRNIRLFPIRDTRGKALRGKAADAESLAKVASGGYVVAFERQHRFWRYDGARTFMNATAVPLPTPAGARNLPPNGGFEALTRLCDGRLLAVAEKSAERMSGVRGWVQSATGWHPLTYRTTADLSPTGAATLPDCDVVFVERSFSILAGLDIRVSRISARTVKQDAVLEPEVLARLSFPLTIDNFEGIATRRGTNGETLIYLVSDDNFNDMQRTLLVMFELMDKP